MVIRAHHIRSYLQAMKDSRAALRREVGRYEIRLEGHLPNRWSDWFDGLTLTRESDGTTLLQGSVVDQSALYGLLQKVRDTGLPLISVTPVDPYSMSSPTHP